MVCQNVSWYDPKTFWALEIELKAYNFYKYPTLAEIYTVKSFCFCHSRKFFNVDLIFSTLREEIFVGINFREFGSIEDFAGINFRALSLTKDFAGINFRKSALSKDFAGVNSLRSIFPQL